MKPWRSKISTISFGIRLRQMIAPSGRFRPQPVVTELRVDVDGSAEGVYRKAVGFGDRPAIVGSGGRDQELNHRGGQCVQFTGNFFQLVGDAVRCGGANGSSTMVWQPGNRLQFWRNLALAAIAVHSQEKCLITDASGVLIRLRRLQRRARQWVGNSELVADVSLVEQFGKGLSARPLPRGMREPSFQTNSLAV